MNQEIEIEYKNMLTKEEFQTLLRYFQLDDEAFKTQTNTYFDTKEFDLRSAQCALRIRTKNGHNQLTLKEPHPEGLLETHQPISSSDAKDMIAHGGCIEGDISQQLTKMNISPSALLPLGELRTNRAEINQDGAVLVFDHSIYLDVEDYELEMEVTNREKGEKQFQMLLEQFNIPKRDTNNKIQRFFNRKKIRGTDKR